MMISWPNPPRYRPAPPESTRSSFLSIVVAVRFSQTSMGVPVMFEGEGTVAAPSVPSSAPKPPEAKKMLEIPRPSGRFAWKLTRLSVPDLPARVGTASAALRRQGIHKMPNDVSPPCWGRRTAVRMHPSGQHTLSAARSLRCWYHRYRSTLHGVRQKLFVWQEGTLIPARTAWPVPENRMESRPLISSRQARLPAPRRPRLRCGWNRVHRAFPIFSLEAFSDWSMMARERGRRSSIPYSSMNAVRRRRPPRCR